jgi:uncharacterized protein (DUF885 family)
MTQARTPTDVDALAETYLDSYADLNPIEATYYGLPDHAGELPDLTPAWYEDVSALRRRTLAALDAAEPVDSTDRITVAALREELECAEALRATGVEESSLRNIASPLQDVRDVFDLSAANTPDDWAVIALRLRAVPTSITGYMESLRFAAARGIIAPQRQVNAGIKQCADNFGDDGFFARFAREAAATNGDSLPEQVRVDLAHAAEAAADAYLQLSEYLTTDLLPAAPERDAVGREQYALHSRKFLGAQVDLEETYAWGQAELARITSAMKETAQEIKAGATVTEAIAYLDSDPRRKLVGTDALQAWMQTTSDAAIEALSKSHFDIPVPIRRLECRIAPTQAGGIYYTGPSDDLTTRPGQMWWSVPRGVTEFATWRELTTVYHEGVPGHHLQIAQTVYRSEILNRWRRLGSWVSGHGEGWALYAERLMADLGFLDDPADYLGMLDGQSMRAARVVLDIGIHCEFPAPAEVGGGAWTYDKAWAFLTSHANMAPGFLRFELDRYLGWPGQAPSYKIGERLWLQARDEAELSEGAAFDLTAFHRRALDIGSVGLDVLHRAVLGEYES